jgi:hypothetical protein
MPWQGSLLTYNALAVTRQLLLPVSLAILLLLDLLLLLLLDFLAAALAVYLLISPSLFMVCSTPGFFCWVGMHVKAEVLMRTYGERTPCQRSELLTARTQRAG